MERDGVLECDVAKFHLAFSADGARFTLPVSGRSEAGPATPDAGPASRTIRYRLEEIRTSEGVVIDAHAAVAPTRPTESEVAYARGEGVIEHFSMQRAGTEQTFSIEKPLGTGDMVLVQELDTDLLPTRRGPAHSPIGFADPITAQRVFTYGAAEAISADGHRSSVASWVEGSHLFLKVDGRWLATAKYPLLIDPFGGGDGTPDPASMRLEAWEGLTKEALAGRYEILYVGVQDAEGAGVMGVRVKFEIVSGGGRLLEVPGSTDESGPWVSMGFKYSQKAEATVIRASLPDYPQIHPVEMVRRSVLPHVEFVGVDENRYVANVKGEPGSDVAVAVLDPTQQNARVTTTVEVLADEQAVVSMPSHQASTEGGWANFAFLVREGSQLRFRLPEFTGFEYCGNPVEEVVVTVDATETTTLRWSDAATTSAGELASIVRTGQAQVVRWLGGFGIAMEPITLNVGEGAGLARAFAMGREEFLWQPDPDAPPVPTELRDIVVISADGWFAVPGTTEEITFIGATPGPGYVLPLTVVYLYASPEWPPDNSPPSGDGVSFDGNRVTIDFTLGATPSDSSPWYQGWYHRNYFSMNANVGLAPPEFRLLNAATNQPRKGFPTYSVFSGDWTPAIRLPADEVVVEMRQSIAEGDPVAVGLQCVPPDGLWWSWWEFWPPNAVGALDPVVQLHRHGVVEGRYTVFRSDPIQATCEIFPSGVESPVVPSDRTIVHVDPRVSVSLRAMTPLAGVAGAFDSWNPTVQLQAPCNGVYLTNAGGGIVRGVPLFVPDTGVGRGPAILEGREPGQPPVLSVQLDLPQLSDGTIDQVSASFSGLDLPVRVYASLTETGAGTCVFSDENIQVEITGGSALSSTAPDTLTVHMTGALSSAIDTTLTLTETGDDTRSFTNGPRVVGFEDRPARVVTNERFWIEERDEERTDASMTVQLSTPALSELPVTLSRVERGLYRSGPLVAVEARHAEEVSLYLPGGDQVLLTQPVSGGRDLRIRGSDFWGLSWRPCLYFSNVLDGEGLLVDTSVHLKLMQDALEKKLGIPMWVDESPTKAEVQQRLPDGSIFYYVGHGSGPKIGNWIEPYYFEGIDLQPPLGPLANRSRERLLTAADVAAPVVGAVPLDYDLVFLNCCLSAQSGAAPPLNYTMTPAVTALKNAFNTRAYVGWEHNTEDGPCMGFAVEFFKDLDGMTPVNNAFNLAKFEAESWTFGGTAITNAQARLVLGRGALLTPLVLDRRP